MVGGSVGGGKGGTNDFFFHWFPNFLIVLSFWWFICRGRSGGLGIGFS
jgi:hypothetical protein